MSDTAHEYAVDDFDDGDIESVLGLGGAKSRATKVPSFNRKRKRKHAQIDTMPDHPAAFSDDVRDMIDKSAAVSGLTFAQRRAVMFIAVFNYTDEQVAAELGRAVATIKKWKASKKFKNALNANLTRINSAAIERRMQLNNSIVDEIHRSVLLSVHRGDLQRLPLEKQIKMLTELSRESRLDDPAAATERSKNVEEVSHKVELMAIQERFNIVENRKRHRQIAETSIVDAEFTEMKVRQNAQT